MTKQIGNILSLAAFAVLFTLCLAFVAIRVSGLGTFIVTGGSMEPTIHKGSLVIDEPVTAALGYVVEVLNADDLGDCLRLGQLSRGDRAEADMLNQALLLQFSERE